MSRRELSAGFSLRKWREEIRGKSAAERVQWLRSAEGIAALGAKVCRDLARAIEKPRDRVKSRLAAPAWAEEWWNGDGELPPGLELGKHDVLMTWNESHRHGVRLVLSDAQTPVGDGLARRRWTPPQAVDVEDALDRMSVGEANFYQYAPSPSAQAIIRIGELRATEV
ncbi:MAG TPA: hypothetical protein VH370_08050 [Humisphaera sp.]|jgi:hypothetical protein|nr:hypothetical protein [Humisphaera sp.]